MFIFDTEINKNKRKLALLYKEMDKATENTEETQALPGSEIDEMIHQIDELIEGDYAQAVYN